MITARTKTSPKANPAKPIASTSTSTISKAPAQQSHNFGTINFDDITDFIPIRNNADDFELAKILDDIENKSTKVVPVTKTDSTTMTPTTTNLTFPSMNTQNNVTVNQPPNFAYLPQMYFPHSTVTINYNIVPKEK